MESELDADAVESVAGHLLDFDRRGNRLKRRVEAKGEFPTPRNRCRPRIRATIRNPRKWKARSRGGCRAEGRQQVTTPMPGKSCSCW